MIWFKLNANFDKDDRIFLIENQKNGDAIIFFYLKLQCIAARCNRGGGLYISETAPYTVETLATQCRKTVNFVKKALQLLENLELIEKINGVIFIADWSIFQNADRLEEIRRKDRERKKAAYEKRVSESKKKEICSDDSAEFSTENSMDNSTELRTIDIDIEKEIDKEAEAEKEKEEDIISEVAETFNAATNFPKIKVLSSAQRELVLKAVKEFGFEQLQFCFQEAGQSEFLNGKNKQGWVANFDWLIKPENIAKVLNGNYSKVYSAAPAENTESSFELEEFINTALKRSWDDY